MSDFFGFVLGKVEVNLLNVLQISNDKTNRFELILFRNVNAIYLKTPCE